MATSTFIQTQRDTQSVTDYYRFLDGDIDVLAHIGDAFATHEQATPDMTVVVDAGVVVSGTSLQVVSQQTTATIVPPVANNRIDLVVIDQATGIVSVVSSAEAPKPDRPALPAGKIPTAEIFLTTSTTAITNDQINDLRPLWRQESLADGSLTRGDTGLALSTTGVEAGSYFLTNLTVDTQGRITAASSGSAVFELDTGTGLDGGPITGKGTISLADTAVTPGTYTLTTLTVDQQGRITAASDGMAVTKISTGTGLSGGPITDTGTISLADTGVTAGSYTLSNVTVDAQGRITAASDGTAVTKISTGTGLTGGPITSTGTISLTNTGVTPGLYQLASFFVDAQGRITGAGNSTAVVSFNGRHDDVTLTSTDVTDALGFTPAPLDSPHFTGIPTAPTPAAGDSSDQVATTAFVAAQLIPAIRGRYFYNQI